MSPGSSLFSLRQNYDAAIAGLIGALLIFLFSRHGGIGLEPDSIVYLSTARSVVQGGGFFEFEGIPTTDFPIGYPAFLSLVLFISRIDTVQSGSVINMFLYFCLIYLSGGIINHISTKNRWIKIPFLFLIVFSPALLSIYTMILSETLFLVLVLLFFLALHRYGQTKTIRALVVVAILAGFSCVVRYAGVTLVGAGGLMLLLDWKLKPGRKFVHLSIFCVIGSAFLIANLYRNYLFTGMLMGDRERSLTSLGQNIQNYSRVIGQFFSFNNFPVEVIILVGIAFFLFYIYSHIIHIYKTNRYYNFWNICAVFFIVYTLFMIFSATFSRYETLNVRLLSPLYLPALLPFTFVITWTISKLVGRKKLSFVSLLVLLFGVISFIQLRDSRISYLRTNEEGIPGYAEDDWKNSPLLHYMNMHKTLFKDDGRIYSDGNEAVYLFTGLRADLIPHVESENENANFEEDQKSEYYLVWFYNNADPELLSLNKLLKEHRYTKLVAYPEGCIYYHPLNSNH
jgi:hypothetical protein